MELALPALIALAGAATGALWATRAGTVVGALLSAAAVEVWLVNARDPDAGLVPLIAGLVLGPAVLGAVPFVVYEQLGRRLTGRPVVLGLSWLVMLVPLYICWLVVALGVAKWVACRPGQYECPV